jgi:hypothetical protein
VKVKLGRKDWEFNKKFRREERVNIFFERGRDYSQSKIVKGLFLSLN